MATLTERLEGRRALYRVVLDSEPEERDDGGAIYDCTGSGQGLRTVWLEPGEPARRTMTVEAVVRRLKYPLLRGVDGPDVPGLWNTG